MLFQGLTNELDEWIPKIFKEAPPPRRLGDPTIKILPGDGLVGLAHPPREKTVDDEGGEDVGGGDGRVDSVSVELNGSGELVHRPSKEVAFLESSSEGVFGSWRFERWRKFDGATGEEGEGSVGDLEESTSLAEVAAVHRRDRS